LKRKISSGAVLLKGSAALVSTIGASSTRSERRSSTAREMEAQREQSVASEIASLSAQEETQEISERVVVH